MTLTPTERLTIEWPADLDLTDDTARGEYALERIHAFADELRARGERPWFEIVYPLPASPHDAHSEAELLEGREAHFDAIEVAADGSISTVPPYAVLRGEVAP